jgi:hypothetical protein
MPAAEKLQFLYGHVFQHAARCLIHGYVVIILQGMCKDDLRNGITMFLKLGAAAPLSPWGHYNPPQCCELLTQ